MLNMTSAASLAPAAAAKMLHKQKRLIMHMEFYWGTVAGVLFNNWPGIRGGFHYFLSLLLTFGLAVLAEYVGRIQIPKTDKDGRLTGLLQAAVYTVKIGLANMVMLAVMSFNGGVFLAAVAGHTLGFMVFGRAFSDKKGCDDPDLNGLCC